MNRKSVVLASAVAALFLAGGARQTLADEAPSTEVKQIKCEGVNSCKGETACKSAQNDCRGKNACKGKGFLLKTPERCEQAKADLKKEPGS